MDIKNAWEFTKGEGVVVAVCDSGVDAKHEDLKNSIHFDGAWDFVAVNMII